MSTLTVGIITIVAVAFVLWYLNRKSENIANVDSEGNKSVAETAPYKVPEPVDTTLSVVEAAPVVEAVAEAQPVPAITAPKPARTRKSTATASKPKVPAKKTATAKTTQTPPATKKARLKTAK
jgi:hypothetical protein